MHEELPPTYAIKFERRGFLAWRLTVRQALPLPIGRVFAFLGDPRNLSNIFPGWIAFRLLDPAQNLDVYRGAEFHYSLRWLGLKLRWHSRITEYHPPGRFTDIQLAGPYRYWRHMHTFAATPEGTLVGEEIYYRIPFAAAMMEKLINRQLADIFAFRAVKAEEWAINVRKVETAVDA